MMEGDGIGSDPCSLLLLRSKPRRLVHGRITGSWWKPVRKLLDRSRFWRDFLLEFHIQFGIEPCKPFFESRKSTSWVRFRIKNGMLLFKLRFARPK